MEQLAPTNQPAVVVTEVLIAKKQTKLPPKRGKRKNGTGSLFYNKQKNQFCGQARDVHGKLRTKFFANESDAQRWLVNMENARERGEATYAKDPNLTVAQFLRGWVERYNAPLKPSNTYRNYKGAIEHRIVPYIGQIKANKLTPHKVEEFLNQLCSEFKVSTAKNAERVLSCAYNYAVKMKDLPYNPVRDVEKISMNAWESPTEPIPTADLERIYSAASLHPYLHARIEIALMLGLRPGEILALRWDDLDTERGALKVRRQVQRVKGRGLVVGPTKTKRGRPIPLSFQTLEILKTHRSFQEVEKASWVKDEGWIFPNSVGKLLDDKGDSKIWNQIQDSSGNCARYTRYQLRKTCYSHLAGSGVDLRTLMDFTGHRQSSTLMKHYVFTNEGAMRDASQKLDELRPKIQG
jgi:integrase